MRRVATARQPRGCAAATTTDGHRTDLWSFFFFRRLLSLVCICKCCPKVMLTLLLSCWFLFVFNGCDANANAMFGAFNQNLIDTRARWEQFEWIKFSCILVTEAYANTLSAGQNINHGCLQAETDERERESDARPTRPNDRALCGEAYCIGQRARTARQR